MTKKRKNAIIIILTYMEIVMAQQLTCISCRNLFSVERFSDASVCSFCYNAQQNQRYQRHLQESSQAKAQNPQYASGNGEINPFVTFIMLSVILTPLFLIGYAIGLSQDIPILRITSGIGFKIALTPLILSITVMACVFGNFEGAKKILFLFYFENFN